jgi:hypothetical protein
MTMQDEILVTLGNISNKTVEKIKTHILYRINLFFRKSCRLWDNEEKYKRAGQVTNGNRKRSSRFACWVSMDKIFIVLYVINSNWYHKMFNATLTKRYKNITKDLLTVCSAKLYFCRLIWANYSLLFQFVIYM